MEKEEFVVWSAGQEGKVLRNGKILTPPAGWQFVPSGDAALTRRLKKGEYWLLVHKRRNRIESLGLWTSAKAVETARAQLDAERTDPAYQKKLESGRRSRKMQQAKYEVEFKDAVIDFLNFAKKWSDMAEKFADAVTLHAVPVGSGTVARTKMIPIERRAEAAVIAWMRHQTTAYDFMTIARVKGERREVRRKLAERSRQLLENYRRGNDLDLEQCPLAKALKQKQPPPCSQKTLDLLSIDF